MVTRQVTKMVACSDECLLTWRGDADDLRVGHSLHHTRVGRLVTGRTIRHLIKHSKAEQTDRDIQTLDIMH